MNRLALAFILLIIASGCGAGKTACVTCHSKITEKNGTFVQTVKGPVKFSSLGKTLPHEHILVDFRGPQFTGGYNRQQVIDTVLPFLIDLKNIGFNGFVDTTPAFMGRDVRILSDLSDLSGLAIITNCGYYGAANDKYLPCHVFTESAEQLAVRWIKEYDNGIDDTRIKPGFIKIAVDPGPLSPVDRKLVEAAALTHLQTGLTISCHTGEARATTDVLNCVIEHGVSPNALIIVHADSIADANVHYQHATSGAWIEYDAVGNQPLEKSVQFIKLMLSCGFGKQLLISQDRGWFEAGEPDGGKAKFQPYTFIAEKLIPALQAQGVSDTDINNLFVANPARAYAVEVRRR